MHDPNKIGPFFKYFGGKHRYAKRYPAPVHKNIIEPFAGSAGYACAHHASAVHLVDLDRRVVDLWHYLIEASPSEILAMPDIRAGETTSIFSGEGQRLLVSCWVNTSPWMRSPSKWMQSGQAPASFWGHAVRQRIAGWLPLIKHWTVQHGTYADIENTSATWFVDPPYFDMGKFYKHGAKQIDYTNLGDWCRSRNGQTIVCEAAGATWLPFASIPGSPTIGGARSKAKKHRSRVSQEVFWVNSAAAGAGQ